MIYYKTNLDIKYPDFIKLAKEVKFFKSLTGKEYEVISVTGSTMYFVRKSTTVKWSMDLKGVHEAYLKLTDFKTANFKPFVDRRHSPALGLLLHLGLLEKS